MLIRAWAVAVTVATVNSVTPAPAWAAAKTNQIRVEYATPKNPDHKQIYAALKKRGSLEKLQKLLSPFRLPRRLKLSVAGCDGEVDAWYGDDAITICYELIEDLWDARPDKSSVQGITPLDAVIGPLFDTIFHEFAHALFDMLKVPVLGREETAADLVAAYMYLQLNSDEARRLITGAAYAYKRDVDEFEPPKLEDFASQHPTPAQRGYNLLCMAYGADKKLFGDFVTKGYLPKSRARLCAEEYEQIQDAFEKLISPHIDLDLADKILDQAWLPKNNTRDVSPKPTTRQ